MGSRERRGGGEDDEDEEEEGRVRGRRGADACCSCCAGHYRSLLHRAAADQSSTQVGPQVATPFTFTSPHTAQLPSPAPFLCPAGGGQCVPLPRVPGRAGGGARRSGAAHEPTARASASAQGQ